MGRGGRYDQGTESSTQSYFAVMVGKSGQLKGKAFITSLYPYKTDQVFRKSAVTEQPVYEIQEEVLQVDIMCLRKN
jgi:hypothetical protein